MTGELEVEIHHVYSYMYTRRPIDAADVESRPSGNRRARVGTHTIAGSKLNFRRAATVN